MIKKFKNIIQNPRIIITILSISLFFLLIIYLTTERRIVDYEFNNNHLINRDSVLERLNHKIDSLNNEILFKEIQIGSYEVMWGILEEVNPNLADSINLMVE